MADYTIRPKPAFTIPSIIAVICAIFSFTRGAAGGFTLAVLAIIFGVLGVVLSLIPGKRGGVISFFSIIAGAFGIIAAIFKLVL